jgi:hypothetical protein
LTSFFQKGRFLLPHTGAEQLEDELIRFPASTKDDIVDSLAYVMDVIYFPKETDPPKIFELPAHLKMTAEQRERESWENAQLEAGPSIHQFEMDDDLW